MEMLLLKPEAAVGFSLKPFQVHLLAGWMAG